MDEINNNTGDQDPKSGKKPSKKSKIVNDQGQVEEKKEDKSAGIYSAYPYYKIQFTPGQKTDIKWNKDYTSPLRTLDSFKRTSVASKPDTSTKVNTRRAKKAADTVADAANPNLITIEQAVQYLGEPQPLKTFSNVGGGFIVVDQQPPVLSPIAPSEYLRTKGADKSQQISQFDPFKDTDNTNKQYCPIASDLTFKPIPYRACDELGKVLETDTNIYIFTGKMANLGRVFMRLSDLQLRLGIGSAYQYWQDWFNVDSANWAGQYSPPFPIWDADGTYLKDWGAKKWSYFLLPQDLNDPSTAGSQFIRYCELAREACFVPAETGGMPWRYWNKAADKTPNKNTDKNPVPTTAAPVAPVTLYFKCYDHLIFDGWEDLFLACVKTAATKSRFNPTVYAKESTDDFFDNNDLVKIGVHPLGLFETYVTSDDLQKMLEMNVDKPIEKDTVPYPTDPAVDEGLNVPSKVKITDDKINKPEDAESIPQPKPGANTIGEENPPAKNDTVTDISTNKLAAARNRERKPGQDDAMGLSAFEVSESLWTTQELGTIGIKGGGDVEWLHRSAFSFGRLKHGKTGTPQTPRNLVWGTSQVNTAMIRAESFVKRVARRTNSTVTLTTSLAYTEAPVDTRWMKPYQWMAPILTYKFTGTGEKLVYPGTNNKATAPFTFHNIIEFMPFERLMPNYLEYFLDTEVEKLIFPWEVTKEQEAMEAFIENGVDEDDKKPGAVVPANGTA